MVKQNQAQEPVSAYFVKDTHLALFKAIEKYKNEEDVYVHFTDVLKLGVNPGKRHRDPHGIYFYPLSFLEKGFAKNQYATNDAYAYIVKIDKSDWGSTGFELQNMTGDEMIALVKRNGWYEQLKKELFDDNPDDWELDGSSIEDSVGSDGVGALLWNIGYKFVNGPESFTTWNKLLKGVTWLEDLGEGIINGDEPSQILVLDVKKIKVLEVVNNDANILTPTLKLMTELAKEYGGSKLKTSRSKDEYDENTVLVSTVMQNGMTLTIRVIAERRKSMPNYLYVKLLDTNGDVFAKLDLNMPRAGADPVYDQIKKEMTSFIDKAMKKTKKKAPQPTASASLVRASALLTSAIELLGKRS